MWDIWKGTALLPGLSGGAAGLASLALAGLLLFVGASFVIVLMIVFLSDCIEYGEWKLGRRNGAVTFALQPFINKIGGAVATAIAGAVSPRMPASGPVGSEIAGMLPSASSASRAPIAWSSRPAASSSRLVSMPPSTSAGGGGGGDSVSHSV